MYTEIPMVNVGVHYFPCTAFRFSHSGSPKDFHKLLTVIWDTLKTTGGKAILKTSETENNLDSATLFC